MNFIQNFILSITGASSVLANHKTAIEEIVLGANTNGKFFFEKIKELEEKISVTQKSLEVIYNSYKELENKGKKTKKVIHKKTKKRLA